MSFHSVRVPSQYAAAVERAETALAARFARHVPWVRDGWLILPHSGRPVAVWDLKEKRHADTPEQEARRTELARTLAAAGLAVTVPSWAFMVFFAEIPADRTGPRYTVVHDDSSLGALFGEAHLVMDTWTNIHVATARLPGEADRRCAGFNRVQEAQVASGSPVGSHVSPGTTV